MKTIGIPEDLHKELVNLKLDSGNRNLADMIRKLIQEHKKKQFLCSSDLFKKKLNSSGKSFEEILRKSKAIREEVADEWF